MPYPLNAAPATHVAQARQLRPDQFGPRLRVVASPQLTHGPFLKFKTKTISGHGQKMWVVNLMSPPGSGSGGSGGGGGGGGTAPSVPTTGQIWPRGNL